MHQNVYFDALSNNILYVLSLTVKKERKKLLGR